MTKPWFVLLAVLLFLPVNGLTGGMKEGLYQVISKTEMPNMPTGMPPHTMELCFTANDLASPHKLMGEGGDTSGCQIKNLSTTSVSMSFDMVCPAQGLTGRGEYQFTEEGYTGQMVLSIPSPSAGTTPMKITTSSAAKRIGPCP